MVIAILHGSQKTGRWNSSDGQSSRDGEEGEEES